MPSAGRSPGRVLVAEDDDSLRRLLEMRLISSGFEVRTAEDGVAAMGVLEEWTPDLVILDVMMPRLSGLTVCREMRACEATMSTPVILLTARCFDEDIQQVLHLGGVEYIAKPFNFKQLERAIHVRLGLLDPSAPRTVTFAEGGIR